MLAPRLKPSGVFPIARALSIASQRAASHSAKVNPFVEINKLAAEGKWDAINNCPKWSLTGEERERANAIYAKIITPEDNFYAYGGQPYGPYVYLVSRVALCFGIIFVGCKIYEFVVPEQYRLKIKYAPKHHAEEHH
uniref:Conserved plasma membrane protein n=1 Tax=Panagrellus redivivus TaxID=6233 RepID=A0A7E4VMS6_PANRE